MLRELCRLLKRLANYRRGGRPNVRWRQRLSGFWHGFSLPPREGFLSSSELRQRVGLS
jgi:hypothetical protein